ncbi:MAG: DUF3109 family protein [Bacteroidota bacterium]
MVEIGAILVDEAISKVRFRCDLEVCRGACCCIEGWRGAPLRDSELKEFEQAVPFASRFLSERNRAVIASLGAYEGRPGDFATTCVDDKECAFVFFDGRGIARCAFDKAFESGLTTWQKPISCHLFPIRVRNHGEEILQYEEIPECHGGRQRGRAEDVALFDFLREPLTRLNGTSWYASFRDACVRLAAPGDAEDR